MFLDVRDENVVYPVIVVENVLEANTGELIVEWPVDTAAVPFPGKLGPDDARSYRTNHVLHVALVPIYLPRNLCAHNRK